MLGISLNSDGITVVLHTRGDHYRDTEVRKNPRKWKTIVQGWTRLKVSGGKLDYWRNIVHNDNQGRSDGWWSSDRSWLCVDSESGDFSIIFLIISLVTDLCPTFGDGGGGLWGHFSSAFYSLAMNSTISSMIYPMMWAWNCWSFLFFEWLYIFCNIFNCSFAVVDHFFIS